MKWFTNLQAKWRIVITVAAWVIVFAFCGAIGGSIGESGENMQVWQAIIFIILLAVSIVFTVFTVKAANQEKKDKAAQEAEQNATKCTPPQQTAQNFTTQQDSEAPEYSTSSNDGTLPIHTKVVGVTFEGRQEYIAKSQEGDMLLIKHQPTEEYPDTIAVINQRTHKRLGTIKSELAQELLDVYGEKCKFLGEILEITGGDGRNYGCNILIAEEIIDE